MGEPGAELVAGDGLSTAPRTDSDSLAGHDLPGSDSPAGDSWVRDSWSRLRSSAPLWLFVGLVVAAFPILLLDIGRYHWFMRDEWVFLVERSDLSWKSLFEPFNVHPVPVPVVAYIGLWNVFGLDSYRPYQAVVIGMHLALVVLMRVLMRNAGVRPWLATVVAASFVFFGPGAQNILWAFQIGFTGGIVWSFAQLVLADHDGPIRKRDFIGLACGLLSIMSTGVGVSMAMAVALGILIRRGIKPAMFHTVPLMVAYLTWRLVENPTTTSFWGDPTIQVLKDWVESGVRHTFSSIGQNPAVAVLLAAILVGGSLLAWVTAWRGGWSTTDDREPGSVGTEPSTTEPAATAPAATAPAATARLRSLLLAGGARRHRVRHLGIPTALVLAALAFLVSTGWTRWYVGAQGSSASRYMHACAAMTLPALAVGAEALARRSRWVTPAVALLLLSAAPASFDAFHPTAFGQGYMDDRRRILTTAVAMPFAREVPPDVRPVPDAYDGNLTIGFLLDAMDEGKLELYPWAVDSSVENEMRIRLGLAQRATDDLPIFCTEHAEALLIEMDEGDAVVLAEPVKVTMVDQNDRPVSPPVTFDQRNGRRLTAEIDGLDLKITAATPGQESFSLCPAGPSSGG